MGRRYEESRRPYGSWYSVESALARRLYGRKLRRQEKAAVRRGDDALPRRRGTQGWLTH